MPIVQIHMMEGRSDAQKEAVIREVTEALARALDAPKESVRVLINEMPNSISASPVNRRKRAGVRV